MANNLFVSYDLMAEGQNYERVAAAIKALGSWAKVHKSLWYVNSSFTASQALDYLQAAVDHNDKILVIDTTNNSAAWNILDPQVAAHIKENWIK
ncbi:hypothetical protein [Cupriavidus pauculus]|uniref:CRISPR-associated protein Cas2 n=1 Tax=Cupriavidus pauculus TaxID=82633 RepID=A0A2N5C3K1_9BURK|nr:hypothetical protein [Cupriavidus pauculus]PLP96785.1 hypothetical protein CYJ10_30875 [Cupriavidus pauculus]